MTAKIYDRNYIAIADWMVELDLTPKELLTYAIIYGFSQDGESQFSGSLSYLSDWLNTNNRNNVLNQLNSLMVKGLISKTRVETQQGTRCNYRALSITGSNRSTDYIYIPSFMVRELHLSGRELLIYALIYGYSKEGSLSCFTGTMSYIAKWIGVKPNHVRERYLAKLIDDGLVQEFTEEGIKKYRAVIPDMSQNYNTPPKEDNPKNITGSPISITPDSPKNITNILDTYTKEILSFVVEGMPSDNLFSIPFFFDKALKPVMIHLESYHYGGEGMRNLKEAFDLLNGVVNCYSAANIRIINDFDETVCEDLIRLALLITCRDYSSGVNSPEARLSSEIGKYIAKYKKKR